MAALGRRWLALCALLFLTLCGTTCLFATGVSAEVAAKPQPTTASASHILVDTEAEADDMMAQLEGHPKLLVEFAKLAQEKSKCPSGKKGGSLGSFGRGRMVPEFDRAVFEQEPHRLYKVQTQFGWHVIYTTQLGEEEESDDSLYRTFIIIMNKAAPFMTPLLLIIIMFFGQRTANKTKGPLARASHILVDTEKEADELLKQIQSADKPKAKLEELARAKSKCSSKKKGGDLGLFGRGQMVPPFEKVAFEKDVDSVHKVQTQFGWHVIMVTDRLGEKKNN
ncbi:hypothetical protein P43SY_010052 [Pythium insidiosum]|uniref:Peptidyl-prolyl cis-trans isomerase n=1 Tax=Pythium insidiosum TaxID=114742 RepID=A0AAD5QBY6_PYTIN|nr:hypothetical protein P43SY_010052 [Pythium insidiosum]